jgi:hypothetical protein
MTNGELASVLDRKLKAAGAGALVAKSFIAFVAWLGVTLEPGQAVIGKVAYDGIDPIDLPATERDIAAEIFGDVERFSASERDVVVVVCGARGGKTYTLVALRVLHLALTVSLDTLAPGEVASAPLIAPGKDDAEQALRYIQGAISSKPALAARVVGKLDASESIELSREDGKTVEIIVRAASARGRTGRGRSLVCAVMDEAAFFYDATYHVNDEEVYRGLSPRILPGGQLIIDSTPWAQAGLLYELFAANHPNPELAGLPPRPMRAKTAIAVHASTLRLRDVPATRAIVEREQQRDPDNALREFGAHFMAAGSATFFEPACIEACLDMTLEQLPREGGVEVVAGADMGFTKNSAALCIGHLKDGIARVAEFVERKPKPGEPLRPGEVASEFVARVVAHGGSSVMADGHYRETVVEHATPSGLSVHPAPSVPADECIAVRARMREGRYRIPNNPRFLRQLRETVAVAGSGGGLTIRWPKWRTGEHGDLAQAFVHMAFQTCGVAVKVPPKTPEQAKRAELDEFFAKDAAVQKAAREREWWDDGTSMLSGSTFDDD